METVIITICSLATGISLFYIVTFITGKEKDTTNLIKKRRLQKIKNREYFSKTEASGTRNAGQKVAGQVLLYYKETFRFGGMEKFLKKFRFVSKLEDLIKGAGSTTPTDMFIIISLVISISLFLLGWIVTPLGIIGGIVLGVFGLIVPTIMLKTKISKRETLFTLQLPDALGLITSSLRAGHSLSAALMIVANELQDPIAGMFKRVVDEINLGRDVKSAFEDLSNAMPGSLDLKFFVTAVLIQREIGGNLAEILDLLNATIRERLKFMSQLKVQTAQAKLSGIILAIAPFGVGGIIYALNPNYMQPLFTEPAGQACVVVAVIGTIVGFFIINKITTIDV